MSKYVSSQFIKSVTKGAKQIAVEYVDKTTTWVRPKGYPSAGVKSEFAEVVEDDDTVFRPETTKDAMKESAHQSDKDKRIHYTAYELDKNGNVINTQHLLKQKQK